VALLLNGCATQTQQHRHSGPVGVLMVEADQQAAKGDQARAIALLERAVRIEPRNAHAWLRLARLHFSAGDLNKAQQFARRAKQFAGADKTLKRECQALLNKVNSKMNVVG